MSAVNLPRSKSHMLLAQFDNFDRVSRSVNEVKDTLKNILTIEALEEVVTTHNLSSPLVAVIQAVPDFVEAVSTFPEQSLFSVIPEHKSSLNQIQGLEALGSAQSDNINRLVEKANAVTEAVERVINGLSEVANIYQIQISSDKSRIEAIELPDDVFIGLPVYTMSEEGFSKFFGMLEKYLKEVTIFNPDHLRENPNELREEIDALNDIVGDLGDALGISVNEYGVFEKNKSDEYTPTASTFGEKGITKATLLMYLDRAYDLCEVLKSIADRKDDLIKALNKACDEIPSTFNSDDDEYGANEHFILFAGYATLTTKLVREAIVLVARLITTADSVIELDSDYAENDQLSVPERIN